MARLAEIESGEHGGEEAAELLYMARLAEIERNDRDDRATLLIGPYTAMVLIGTIQLATRHPTMPPTMKNILRDLLDQLKPLFAGTPGEEIIKKGEHPEWDS